jgi:hypothetical protein
MTADLRALLTPAPASEAPPLPLPASRRPPRWVWPAGLAAACLIAGLAGLWVTTREDLTKLRAELASLHATNTDLQRARTDLTAAVKDLTAALAVTTATTASTGPSTGPSAGMQRSEPVPYGEIPFDRSRLDVLRDLLSKLEAQGFHGVVKITSVPGSFCLSGNAVDGFAPAGANLPASKCDLVGNPFEESLSGQQRQSLAFANLVAGIRQRTSGAITVAFENAGASHAAIPYPQRNELLTAGEWNRAAAANNRVEFVAESSSTP